MPVLKCNKCDTNLPDIPSLIQGADGPEPIAIIGIGCRLPGDVSSASECWKFLKAAKDSRSEFPTSRFNIEAFHSSKKGTAGTLPMRGGYFLNQDVRNFDNRFFGINNLEATYMDPQQRNLLEVVYECFESAGIRLEDIAGSNIGCYVGDFVYDFLVMQSKDDEGFHRYSPTGKGRTILSNRISHAFDLHGPSLTLDTACSSSLYCLHLACRALLQGDCDAAVVASSNLIQTPEQQMDVAASGVLSPTSTCHAFDASADGYGRADSIGALYIKRLSDAVRDNDPIRSIIRATATNSNGQTPGITLPSPTCQEAVIRKAYNFAKLDPSETHYFECHGTGTPVGDPIEVSAVARFRSHANSISAHGKCLIGSVKPSFGHSEAASGITSIIKATLALEHLQIPATVGIQNLNPNIPWNDYNIAVVRALTDWPVSGNGHVPRISVNSFGYGGANAHCILDNADAWIKKLMPGISSGDEVWSELDAVFPRFEDEQAFLLPFSAKNASSLTRRMEAFAGLNISDINLPDLAYTLSTRRSIFEHRSFTVARGTSWADDFKTISSTASSQIIDMSKCALTFVFTGQGAQWPQMGKRLFDAYSPFRNSILRLEYHLHNLPNSPSWSLVDAIVNKNANSDNHPLLAQTICTAVQVALVDLLRSWDITASTVVGHSSGEIAAAYAAGHISATYALEIAYIKGLVVSTNQAPGSMMVAAMSFDEAQNLLIQHDLASKACIACHNSPKSVTISGDEQAIDKVYKALQESGMVSRKLNTGGQAYHSHHMRALGATYQSLLRDALHREKCEMSIFANEEQSSFTSSGAVMISTVLGRPVTSDETIDPAYWRANLESPVLFNSAVEALSDDQSRVFVEIGPHHSLRMPVQQIEAVHRPSGTGSLYLSALVRNKCSERTALALAGDLWVHGYSIDFEKIRRTYRWTSRREPKVLHDLPNYPWDHSKILWKEPRASAEYRNRQFPRDELIGSRIPGSNGRTITWRGLLDVANVPWLKDHKLGANIVLPGACYISMACRACQQLLSAANEVHALELWNVNIEKVMLLRVDSSLEVFTELRPLELTSLQDHAQAWEFIISSVEDDRSIRHASGRIEAFYSANLSPIPDVIIESNLHFQSLRLWYSRFIEQGLAFGPAFQSLDSLSVPRQRDQLVAEAELKSLPKEVLNEHGRLYPLELHPIATDALFQVGLIATAKGELEGLSGRVPVSIDRLRIFGSSSRDVEHRFKARASAKILGPGSAMGQCQLLDSDGNSVLQIQNIKVAPLQEMDIMSASRSPILQTVWVPDLSKLGRHCIDEFARILSSKSTSDQSLAAIQLASFTEMKAKLLPDCKVLIITNHDGAFVSMMASALKVNDFSLDPLYTIGLSEETGKVLCLDMQDGNVPDSADFFDQGILLSEQKTEYDVIMLSKATVETSSKSIDLRTLYSHLRPGGFVLSAEKSYEDDTSDSGIYLDDLSFGSDKGASSSGDINGRNNTASLELPTTEDREHLTISFINQSHMESTGESILIAFGQLANPLDMALLDVLQRDGFQTTMIKFDDLTEDDVRKTSIVMVTAELEKSIVANSTPAQFTQIQLIANHASKVVWLSGGNLLSSDHPEYCSVLGLSRSIMAGNPAITFAVVDIHDPSAKVISTIANIRSILQVLSEPGSDLEYIQKNGLLYVSRLLPRGLYNEEYNQKKQATSKLVELSQADEYELQIRDPGQFDTLEFRHSTQSTALPPDYIEVSVKAVGMNAKDLYTLSGKIDTVENTCSCEFSGIVCATGSAVNGFAVGDRIVSSSPGRYRPKERVPASVCYKLKNDEGFVQLASVPMVYGTAIHAIRNLANLQPGESVLIHSAAGGVGTAAILVAKSIGAEIYATVGNEKKKTFLVDQYGLHPDRIFHSRDTSFLPAILKATDGNGVDVVLNSLTGARLHASLDVCAKFGRFVEIGKRDILDAGNLNMRVFEKGITFSAFDLHELYYSSNPRHRHTYEKLLIDAVEFYRSAGYVPDTTTSFDVSDISSAFRYFANSSRIGKVAITYDNSSSLVPLVAPKFTTRFSADKSYLLIGCLGGLGRSISRYMRQNGARNFTFLGRTGTSKPAAAMLVADLEEASANVKVITGDVCSLLDVETAVEALSHPLGGVIQAAMGLSEALFPAMTHSAWHTALEPKIRGTWNIHNAISGHEKDLDFFLLTSSIAGTIGFSTEANYCTANCFLDHFASFRRKQGLKASSVALGPVSGAGIVHENPEIENVFFRGGITEISEDDMLCVIDVALSRQHEIAHLVTGLEPERAKPGFEESWEMLAPDPRLVHITAAHRRAQEAASSTSTSSPGTGSGSTLDSRLMSLLKTTAASKPDPDMASLDPTIHTILAEQLGKLVLTEPEKIGKNMYLTDVGMDSTLAAQFRTYVYRSTGADVSFVLLMDAKTKMEDLVSVVRDGLLGARGVRG